jgi:hypothetical protein
VPKHLNKQFFLFLWLLFFQFGVITAKAQIIVSGTIQDSLGNYINGASVILQKKSSKVTCAFTITNPRGFYTITFSSKFSIDSFYIKVIVLGYALDIKAIPYNNATVSFILKNEIRLLPIIEVKNKSDFVKYRRDTLSYVVDSFIQQQDRTIGEVLKKIPGIDVDANGKISYNGKRISNFYIDGDDILDDKYNLATNSIDASLVKDIQILENHQPIKLLKDKISSDKVALNLNIKPEARLKLLGRAESGLGLADEFIGDQTVNLMAFKSKYKAINSFKGNNSGKNIANDILSHNVSDLLKTKENRIPSDLLGINDPADPPISESRYLCNKTGLINVNNLVKIKKDAQVKINFYYLKDERSKNVDYYTYYYLLGDTITYIQKQQALGKSNGLHTQLNFSLNSEKKYINNTFLIESLNSPTESSNDIKGNILKQALTQTHLTFSNNFSVIKFVREKIILHFDSYILFLNKPETLEISPGISSSIFNNSVPYDVLRQKVNVPGFYTNQSITLDIPSKKIIYTFIFGFASQAQKFRSTLSAIESNGGVSALPDSFANSLRYNSYAIKGSLNCGYSINKWKVNLSTPFEIMHISFQDDVQKVNNSSRATFFLVKPFVAVRYQTLHGNYYQVYYNFNNDITTIENAFDGIVLNNYQQLYKNGISFGRQNTQTFGINYNYKKASKVVFANFGFTYSKFTSNYSYNTVLQNNIQQVYSIPLVNSTENKSFYVGFSKYIFKIHSTFSIKVSASQVGWMKLQNSQLLKYNNNNYLVNLGFTPKINSRITVGYTGMCVLNVSMDLSKLGVNRKSFQFNQGVELNYFCKKTFFFSFFLNDISLKNSSGNNFYHYNFFDASATYKLTKRKLDFKFLIQNLAGVKEYKTILLTGNILNESHFYIRPQSFMAKVFFNF